MLERNPAPRNTQQKGSPMFFNNIVWFIAGMVVMDVLWAWKTGFLGMVVRRYRS